MIMGCLCLVCTVMLASAQTGKPVHWVYAARKTGPGTYEIRLSAVIESGWHIYSQTTARGGPVATKIRFTPNPLVSMQGDIAEAGKLEQRNEPLFDGVLVKQYSDKVDFIQSVKVKGAVKMTITGIVEFMVCNDEECMPPDKEKFSVVLK